MINGYLLSVLGIVIAGVVIDIIIPSGEINKYIKSVYSIFVVAVLISPVIKFLSKNKDFNFQYSEYEADEKLLNFIYTRQIDQLQIRIEDELMHEGFEGVDIIIDFSINNNELVYNSCKANTKNMFIVTDKQHINSYEFIKNTVARHTGLKDEVIMVYEW